MFKFFDPTVVQFGHRLLFNRSIIGDRSHMAVAVSLWSAGCGPNRPTWVETELA